MSWFRIAQMQAQQPMYSAVRTPEEKERHDAQLQQYQSTADPEAKAQLEAYDAEQNAQQQQQQQWSTPQYVQQQADGGEAQNYQQATYYVNNAVGDLLSNPQSWTDQQNHYMDWEWARQQIMDSLQSTYGFSPTDPKFKQLYSIANNKAYQLIQNARQVAGNTQ